MTEQNEKYPKWDYKYVEASNKETELDDCELKRNYTQEYIITFISGFIMLNTGINYSWIGPILPQLLSGTFKIHITMEQSVWILALINIGAIPGCFVASIISNRYGRKTAIFMATIPFLISAFTYFFAENVLHYYIARFIGGFGDGVSFSVIPMYISEISSPEIRGILGTSIYMSITMGVLFVYIMSAYLPVVTYCAVCTIFPIIQLISIFYLPETPYFLVTKHDFRGAERSLKFLRKKLIVREELKRLIYGYEKENAEKKQSFLDLFRDRTNLRSLIIISVLFIAQQWTGSVAIFGYSKVIYKDGHSSISAEICGIFFAVTNCFVAFICGSLVDRFGRRFVIIISGITTILPLAMLGGYFYLQNYTNCEYIEKLRLIPLIGIVFYKLSAGIGLDEIPYIMEGELFPTSVKPYALSFTSVIGSVIGVVANKMYQVVYTEFGYPAIFGMFIMWIVLVLIFVYFMVPETKGLTLEEIQIKLRKPDKK